MRNRHRHYAANEPRWWHESARELHPADRGDASTRMPWWFWPLGAVLFALFASGWVR